jgi:hypothetical protein
MPLVYYVEFREQGLDVRIEEEGRRRILYLDTLKALAKAEDRDALSFLTKIHLRSPNVSRSSDVSFQQIAVSREESSEALRLLAKTGRIHYKNAPPQRKDDTPLAVFPQLDLTDGTGCFGNLWMEYPGVGRVAFDDLAPTIAKRKRLKKEEENWEKDLLEAGFSRKVVENSRYYCPGDKVRETLFFLLDLGWKLFDAKGRAILRQKTCEWSCKEEGNRIAVRGRVHFQEGSACLSAASQARGLLVELGENQVGLLDRKSFEIEGEWDGETLIVSRRALGAVAAVMEKGRVDWEDNLRRLAEGLKPEGQLEPAPPGEGFRGELLPYQQKGVDWLAFLHRWGLSGLLADEMGLGKTVQVLAFFSRLRTNLPILVVVPSSLLYHWRSEIGRFLPAAEVYVHAGPDRSAEVIHCKGFVITSYALLRWDEELLSTVAFEAVVLDEANAIKTAATQTAQAAYRMNGLFKIALTGTPMENRPEELWSQFRFLMPDLFGGRADFQAAGFEAVRRKMRPFLLRRKKADVEIELPDKIEQIAWVEMSDEQSQVYDSYRAGLKGGLLKQIEKDGAQAHRMQILEAILRLRQICCDPRLIGSPVPGTKLELLLQDLDGRKVLIFSQFTSMLQLIGKALREEGRDYLYLDGSVGSEERAERVKKFQEDPETSLFLLSLKAGGVGLNLTAADYVLLFDPWWNEAVENQAIDRAHRIGQKRTVIAKRYLVPNSIEEKMLRLKEEKRAVAEQLLEGESFSWTEEDLLHLLS